MFATLFVLWAVSGGGAPDAAAVGSPAFRAGDAAAGKPGPGPTAVPGTANRAPDDFELFLEEILEAPRGARRPWLSGVSRPVGVPVAPVPSPCPGGVCGRPAPPGR